MPEPLDFGARLRRPRPPRLDCDAEGLTGAYRPYNLDGCDAPDLVGFVTVASDFYPELGAHYQEEAGEWLAGSEAERL